SVLFLVLIIALAFVFLLMRVLEREHGATLDPAGAAAGTDPVSWSDRLAWIGLALVPAALLTAFTTHVTTDVASAPLLWVLPLALYLLTFVLVFRERPLIAPRIVLGAQLIAVSVALLVLSQTKHDSWFVTAPTGVAAFITSAMVAHRTLYEARPPARRLTEFYLWMAFGGALGGLTAALIAPKVFHEVFEYPLLLALSMACRPGAITGAAIQRALATLAAGLGRLMPRLRRERVGTLSHGDKSELLVLWLIVAGG